MVNAKFRTESQRLRPAKMPQLGSDKKPIILNGSGKKSTRVLGLLGRVYAGKSKENFDKNYDRIFGKKIGDKNG